MKTRYKAAAAGIALALLLGIGFTGTAHASQSPKAAVAPAAASPWVNGYVHAYMGNGCVSTANNNDESLSPLISQRCSDSQTWLSRDLSRETGGVKPGDEIEIVDDSETYAWGFSGYQEKLETPNSNVYYLYVNSIDTAPNGTVWVNFTIPNYPGYGIEPSGAGEPLTLENPQPDGYNDEWDFCPTSTPQCTYSSIPPI